MVYRRTSVSACAHTVDVNEKNFYLKSWAIFLRQVTISVCVLCAMCSIAGDEHTHAKRIARF